MYKAGLVSTGNFWDIQPSYIDNESFESNKY